MRPLDRLFGALPYPYDVLLPSASWLALCAAAMVALFLLLRRRGAAAPLRPLRVGMWVALVDAALWVGVVAGRALHEGGSPSWLAAIEAPLAAVRGALDTVMWNALGVSAAVEPAQLFRGYSSWTGSTVVLLAALLNEAAFLALLAAAATGCAAWRASRR
jgi:hypothetical protein